MFRLYFLCIDKVSDEAPLNLPQHVHLASLGYDLQRTQEFFQKFGYFVLHVLLMVKQRFSCGKYIAPPQDTANILWGSSRNHLSKDTIGPHVDKAIAFLHELSPPELDSGLKLTQTQCMEAVTYLNVHDGDNSDGGLYKVIDHNQNIHWRCQGHMSQSCIQEALEALEDFVHGHGGHIDMQQAIPRAELRSESEAYQFLTLLIVTKHIFNISLKIDWTATRSDLGNFFIMLGKTKLVTLEIDGITHDIHPQDPAQYMIDFFNYLLRKIDVQLITLLNYPQPQVQCIYNGGCSIQLSHTPGSSYDWLELNFGLQQFMETISKVNDAFAHMAAFTEIQEVLNTMGL